MSLFVSEGGYLTSKWTTVCPHDAARAEGVGAKKKRKPKALCFWEQIFQKVTLMGAQFVRRVPLAGYF